MAETWVNWQILERLSNKRGITWNLKIVRKCAEV